MRGSTEIPSDQNSFDPQANAAMATALEQVCEAHNKWQRVGAWVIAVRIIELARRRSAGHTH